MGFEILLDEEAFQLMQSVDEIADVENWDQSDSQVDYFFCNYYLSLHVGKWNKDFVIN